MARNFSDIKTDGNLIYAKAGALMSSIAASAAKASLTGFETLAGIPGSLGGALYMNAGAYGGEIGAVVRNVRYIDETGVIYSVSAVNVVLDTEKVFFQMARNI